MTEIRKKLEEIKADLWWADRPCDCHLVDCCASCEGALAFIFYDGLRNNSGSYRSNMPVRSHGMSHTKDWYLEIRKKFIMECL